MWRYREQKENAKNDLFSALLFLTTWSYLNGSHQSENINDLRKERLRFCEITVMKYIEKKWNK